MARLLRLIRLMNQAADILKRLRKLAQFDAELRKLSNETEEYEEMRDKIESLRAPLPTSILGHYDGRKARGKLAIAPVHRGVCGACHLSIPSGRLSDLRRNLGSSTSVIIAEYLSFWSKMNQRHQVFPLRTDPIPKPLKPKRAYAKRS